MMFNNCTPCSMDGEFSSTSRPGRKTAFVHVQALMLPATTMASWCSFHVWLCAVVYGGCHQEPGGPRPSACSLARRHHHPRTYPCHHRHHHLILTPSFPSPSPSSAPLLFHQHHLIFTSAINVTITSSSPLLFRHHHLILTSAITITSCLSSPLPRTRFQRPLLHQCHRAKVIGCLVCVCLSA